MKRGQWLLAVGLWWLMGASACSAEPPAHQDGSFPPLGSGPFPSLASCAPKTACPGAACAQNVAGKPDGKTTAMTQCPTLDAIWTGGTLRASAGSPEVAIHVASVAGLTRVEASADGITYTVVGFIGGLPPGTTKRCLTTIQGNRVLVELDSCNTTTNISQLRLTRDTSTGGGLVIDAIEALSFYASSK